jgi:2-hydroxy-6-oxonona-2,4-dienedioate hydrolase
VTRRAAAVLAIAAIALAAAAVYIPYHRDIEAARARVATGARVVATPCGPIQYAELGEGRPLLLVHGAGGGFDQGLDFVRPLAQRGFRLIAVSRFGYLGTPMPADASAQAQARAHGCLLDALGIERTAILGGSAGAPSAMQFAILHPGRTSHLILLVPATYVPRPDGAPPLKTPSGTVFLFDTALGSDFLFWALVRGAPATTLRSILATPPEVVAAASAADQARVREVMDHILPVTLRRRGLVNDAMVISTLPRYELERIAAPTLIFSASDDLFGTWDGARYSAAHIPRARLVGFEQGGHLLVGHDAELLAEIEALVR